MIVFRSHGEVSVVIYDSKITAMNMPGGMVYRYTDHKTESALIFAKAFAPKRSGHLAGGVRKDVRQTSRDRVVGRVRSTAYYSTWVIKGTTGPITSTAYPNKQMVLRPGNGFGWKRKYVVRGQRPNDFLSRALAATIGGGGSFPLPLGPANPFI
jgi:hypothetical protein